LKILDFLAILSSNPRQNPVRAMGRTESGRQAHWTASSGRSSRLLAGQHVALSLPVKQ
jgi:hypothetical protein